MTATFNSLASQHFRLYSREDREQRKAGMASHGTVKAINGLTARWAAALPHDGTVFAAAGVWPLLGLLADGAAGPARQELSDASASRRTAPQWRHETWSPRSGRRVA